MAVQSSETIHQERIFSHKYRKNSIKKSEFALLISGASMSLIFEDEQLAARVNEIFKNTVSVVVYRSSPSEKAKVVKFIMKNESDAYTLAIGDGANDVNMI